MAIKQTFDELKLTTRLPSPPGVGMRVLELTRGEDYSAQDIADAIMADSALTGRLLKIANNALNSSAHPVTTISEATMRLGVMAVRNVALGLSLISANRQGNCAKFDYERYWSVSLARAIAAQAISRHRGQISPSEAYVMGLLCDIGSLAIASVYSTEYGELLEQNPGMDRRDLADLERQAFGINHCEIGAFMVQDWGLPGSYSQAILAYEAENPTMATRDPAGAKLAVILNDAEKIARVLLLDDSTHQLDWAALVGDLDGVHERMGLSPEESSAFHEKLARELREWLRMLKLPNHEVIELNRVRQTAQQASEQAEAEASAEETVVEAESASVETAETPSATEEEGIRILVADDDSSSLNVLKQTLTRAGHIVIPAKDGREALQLALEHNPQAVIADWSMPGMDGLELCRALRSIELGREIYFLLLTGGEDEQRIVHAFDAGVDDFISKPLSPRMLLARLKGGQRLLQLKAERERDQQRMIDQVKELTIAKRRLKAAASTDALTELPNRRAILEVLDAEWAVACGSGAPLSVMMIDIDHFKRINDQHGHDVGDEVLRQVARALRGSIRQGEEVARLGGEEFLVVCPNSNLEQCLIGAERIRRAVELQMIHFGSFHGSVTASFGVAQRSPGMTESAMLLKTADEAVYAAKAAGRNCVHPRAEGSIKAQSA